MRFVADIHLHSRYSRATSRDLGPQQIARWAALKGVDLVGTGDFTHPAWLQELRDQLEEIGDGFLAPKPKDAGNDLPAACQRPVRFVLTAEISSIYKKNGRTRKVHNLIVLPSLDAAERFNQRLTTIGNLQSDGRPILGLDSYDLLSMTLDICPNALFIPAHIWTPHFSVLGAHSGFDSMEECYEDLLNSIPAIETGLSSDPPMNWRLSQLDAFTIVSNSDAHSAQKLGREATCFDADLSYQGLHDALWARPPARCNGTLEFYPQEGKYHHDGHRKCGVSFRPSQTLSAAGICPRCGRPLTVGVLHRVELLADRAEGVKPTGRPDFEHLVPLTEVIGSVLGVGAGSRRVQTLYNSLLERIGPELYILRDASLDEVARHSDAMVAEGVRRMRAGQVILDAGFDGRYGTVAVFTTAERTSRGGQTMLSGLEPAADPASARAGEPSAGENPGPALAGRRAAPALSTPTPDSQAATSADTVPALSSPPVSAPGWRCASAALGPSGHTSGHPSGHIGGHTSCHTSGPEVGAATTTPAQQHDIQGMTDIGTVAPDADQQAVVEAGNGPLIVVAGPGSGKTRTLVARVVELVRKRAARPEQIMAITFTNRAAGEMRQRLRTALSDSDGMERLRAGTFHGLALQLLEEAGHRPALVLDEVEARQTLAASMRQAGLKGQVAKAASAISLAKAGGDPDAILAGTMWAPALTAYQERLATYDAWDFDDILLNLRMLLQQDATLLQQTRRRFPWLLVDEFQDVNVVQYDLVKLLGGDGTGLLVIGDPDQAIYGFRGAESRFFDQLRRDYPAATTFHLRRNYRSQANVVRAAAAVIRAGEISAPAATNRETPVLTDHLPPAMVTARRALSPVAIRQATGETGEGIAIVEQINRMVGGADMQQADRHGTGSHSLDDFAVLFRTGTQAAILEECFTRAGLPYRVLGQKGFLEAASVRTALCFAHYVTTPENDLRLMQALELPPFRPERIGLEAVQQALTHAGRDKLPAAAQQAIGELDVAAHRFRQLTPVEFCARWIEAYGDETDADLAHLARLAAPAGSLDDLLRIVLWGREADYETRSGVTSLHSEAVSLLTLHAAKGLEFPVVFICGLEDGLVPLRGRGVDLEEERRLLYVGMTRARDELILLHTASRMRHGQRHRPEPSPFLADLPPGLLAQDRDGPAQRGPRVVQLSLL